MHFYTLYVILLSAFYNFFIIYRFNLEMTIVSIVISDTDVRGHLLGVFMKLELTREEILEKLIHSYEGYFDIERSDDFEPPLQAVILMYVLPSMFC